MTSPSSTTDVWHIGSTPLHSRFLLGTAGYPSPDVLRQAIEASGSQVLTLGLKRTLAAPGGGDNGFVQIIRDTAKELGAHLLPNTAGCRSAREAINLAYMARELLGTNWIKLEVVGDEHTLQRVDRRLDSNDPLRGERGFARQRQPGARRDVATHAVCERYRRGRVHRRPAEF